GHGDLRSHHRPRLRRQDFGRLRGFREVRSEGHRSLSRRRRRSRDRCARSEGGGRGGHRGGDREGNRGHESGSPRGRKQMTAPLLTATGVETYYGKIVALRGVDVEVNPGEIVTLI